MYSTSKELFQGKFNDCIVTMYSQARVGLSSKHWFLPPPLRAEWSPLLWPSQRRSCIDSDQCEKMIAGVIAGVEKRVLANTCLMQRTPGLKHTHTQHGRVISKWKHVALRKYFLGRGRDYLPRSFRGVCWSNMTCEDSKLKRMHHVCDTVWR